MPYARIGVVTGANKGIGYAIGEFTTRSFSLHQPPHDNHQQTNSHTVRQLALQYPKSPLNTGPLLIYLTARDTTRGTDAVTALTTTDPALHQARALHTQDEDGLTTIQFHPLDISSPASITTFTTFLKTHHPTGIDFLINNAAIAMEGFNPTVVRTTLNCNYHGTLAATWALLPLLKPSPPNDSRVVNVASESGLLNRYAPSLRERFLRATSVANITALMDEFTAAVERGKEKEEGWPSAAYAVSKAGTVGLTVQIGEEVKKAGGEREGVLVNACCPGWVVTDMTKGKGHKTPDQGAQTPVMLAIGDVGGKSGGFWKDEREISWVG